MGKTTELNVHATVTTIRVAVNVVIQIPTIESMF